MAQRKKGLGKGLDAVFSTADLTPGGDGPAGTPMLLSLDDMAAGQYQPRTRMDEGALYELAESIKAQGIMQPILVRRLAQPRTAAGADGAQTQAHYEIIAGERRFRAARLAGLAEVPVLVRDVPDDAAAAMALIENIQREDLNPLEEAQGIQRLVADFGLTHEQAAQAVGKSRSAASNLLRLLQLAEPVQTMLMAGDVDMGHARALLALQGAAQITAANEVAAKKLSVRQTEALVRRLTAPSAESGARPRTAKDGMAADIARVERELADLLTADVQVRVKKRRRTGAGSQPVGELAIQFSSMEELNHLIDRLRASGG